MAEIHEGPRPGAPPGSRRLRLGLLALGCLCAVLAVLLIHAWVQNAKLLDFAEKLGRMDRTDEPQLWQIMTSHGLAGRKIRVQVGDAHCAEFTGTPDRETFAQWLGPAHAAALPASGRPERVVVAVDGATVFDQIIDVSEGAFLVIQGDRTRGASVRQAKVLAYM